MIRAQLSVGPPARGREPIPEHDDWGTWDLASLPRAGDVLELTLNDKAYTVVVERVTHYPVQHPLPRTETPYRQRKEPSMRILARSLGRWRAIDATGMFSFSPAA